MKNCNCCTTYNAPDLMDGGVMAARIEEEAKGWVDGGTVGNAAYWRARAEDAEDLCRTETAVANHRGATIERLAKERNDAQAMAALWKETARRAVRQVHDEEGLTMRAVRSAHSLAQQARFLREDIEKAEKERDEARGHLRDRTADLIEAIRDRDKARRERAAVAEESKARADSIREQQKMIDRLRGEQPREGVGRVGYNFAVSQDGAVYQNVQDIQPRPITPDDITDEMCERASRAYFSGTAGHLEDFRRAITAALTEPTRPEGAEDIETDLRPLDLGGVATPEQVADHLASMGYRKSRAVGRDAR